MSTVPCSDRLRAAGARVVVIYHLDRLARDAAALDWLERTLPWHVTTAALSTVLPGPTIATRGVAEMIGNIKTATPKAAR